MDEAGANGNTRETSLSEKVARMADARSAINTLCASRWVDGRRLDVSWVDPGTLSLSGPRQRPSAFRRAFSQRVSATRSGAERRSHRENPRAPKAPRSVPLDW